MRDAIHDRFICGDCGSNTLDMREYYVVNKCLWRDFGNGLGMLCVGCFEKRLGRKLTTSDFLPSYLMWVPYLPQNKHLSSRLKQRIRAEVPA